MGNSIIGIPTTRVSDLFVRDRLLNQVQYDQTELLRLQTQLSTGHRFDTPSEDPIAASRVSSLQSLLQRKGQMQTNLSTNQSYLNATDSALSNIWSLMNDARSTALGVIGTTATDAQRQAAAQQIDQILAQLVDTGNQNFRGRYLFAGSDSSTSPFQSANAKYYTYVGDEKRLSSYGDLGQLFDTNLTGSEVFGAISDAVRGATNVTPVLTTSTRLADLRGGQGITRGGIAISDGQTASVIDLSGAETVGDVAALIEAHPPGNRTLSVDIDAKTLVIRVDPLPGHTTNLSIREVGGGTTAAQLGILHETGVGDNPIESSDLKPVLQNTTPLDDILGAKARAAVHSVGSDNDLIVQADTNGDQLADGAPLNGVRVSFVNDPTVVAGKEWVDYDGSTSLVVHVQAGYTRAKNVVAAINAAHSQGQIHFTAAVDPLDDKRGGEGLIDIGASAATRDGSGTTFDRSAGLQIGNQDQTFTISLTTASTVEDVLNLINGSGAGVVAAINATGNGFDVRSRVSGCNFTIGENGGTAATQLGLRTFTDKTRLDDLNFGRGVQDWVGNTGTNPTATCTSADNNSTLVFQGKNLGLDWNGFTVRFTNTADSPSVNYDLAQKTLEFKIHAGTTTANDVLAMFQNAPVDAQNAFQVSLGANADGSTNTGAGKVDVGSAATSGGDDSGIDFYITRADGVRLAVDVKGAATVGDILDKINNNIQNTDHALVAGLAKSGNGIELTDSSQGSGALRVDRNPMSQAAIDLGLVPAGQPASVAATSVGRATLAVDSTAAKSGLIFTATGVGSGDNGVRVVFRDNAPTGPVYDQATSTLTFGITAGVTTAQDIVQALNQSSYATRFSAAYDPADTSHNDGTGVITAAPAPTPLTAGGSASTYARTNVSLSGYDNDLIFTARQLGSIFNATEIRFQATAGHPAAVLSYTRGNELTFGYDPGVTTAQDIIAALGANTPAAIAASADFSAGLDPADASPNDGSGAVDATTIAVKSAAPQSGLVFAINDPAQVPSGVKIVFQDGAPTAPSYDSATNTLTFGITAGVTTAQDIRAALLAKPDISALFSAALDPADTSGNNGSGQVGVLAAPTVMEGGSIGGCATATAVFAGPDNDLTFRARAQGTALDDTQIVFNPVAGGPVAIHHDPDHKTLTIDFDPNAGAHTTAQQIVDAFANDPDFQVTLAPADSSPNNGSGKVDAGVRSLPALAGGAQTLTGSDVNPLETEGVLTALSRIRDGLQTNDMQQVQRAMTLLDQRSTDLSFSRAELASRQQNLDVLQTNQGSENIDLQKALSDEYDAPLEQVISQLTARQAAYEASLRATALVFQMSLLNFL